MSATQIAAAVAAVLVAAFMVRRWSRLAGERKLLGVGLWLALAVYASGVLSELPDPKAIIVDVAEALGPWTYALVGVMAFLETGAFVGLVAPGETVVIAGGVIAGEGTISLLPLIGLVWLCAVLGDSTSFYIGRRLGRGFLERHGPRVGITAERLEQVESYFDRHGGKTILIGRFIGLVRALAPFVAGSSGLVYRRFIPYSIVGTGLWAGIFCVLGFIFWRSFDRIVGLVGQALFGFGATVALIVGIVVAYKRRGEIRAWLLAHRNDPLVRPLFLIGRPLYRRVIRPVWEAAAPHARFLWERVTPGHLGLELTTAMAAAGTGIFVFLLYVFELEESLQPTPLDNELLDLSDRLHNGMADDLLQLLSALGSLPVVGVLVLVTCVILGVRRHVAPIVAIVVGLGLIVAAVHIAKAAIDRPRPSGALVEASLSSFPSGHAAYATAWIAAALVLGRRRVGVAGETAWVLGAIVLTAAVGLSRIYLRVHYWSDVAAGWALGAGIFGLLAAIALVVDYIRHNGGQGEPAPSEPPVVASRR
jgi:membrane protein DedA with SNARE-associated domain/membrane-associated phospholipid phosphatase